MIYKIYNRKLYNKKSFWPLWYCNSSQLKSQILFLSTRLSFLFLCCGIRRVLMQVYAIAVTCSPWARRRTAR